MSIKEGDPAPAFDLPGIEGRISSAALHGKPYVVYFYPRDDTPGCTKEAIGFTQAYPAFQALGVEVVGVSKDTVTSHERFKAKHGLCFPLASDEAGSVVEAFGAWGQKSMYGRKYMGIDRATFLVGADGHIKRVWREVKVPGHVEEVLAAARGIAAA